MVPLLEGRGGAVFLTPRRGAWTPGSNLSGERFAGGEFAGLHRFPGLAAVVLSLESFDIGCDGEGDEVREGPVALIQTGPMEGRPSSRRVFSMFSTVSLGQPATDW